MLNIEDEEMLNIEDEDETLIEYNRLSKLFGTMKYCFENSAYRNFNCSKEFSNCIDWKDNEEFKKFYFGDLGKFKDYIISCADLYFNDVEFEISKPIIKKNLVSELRDYFQDMKNIFDEGVKELTDKLGCPCCNLIMEFMQPEQETLFYNCHLILMLKELHESDEFINCIGLCNPKHF